MKPRKLSALRLAQPVSSAATASRPQATWNVERGRRVAEVGQAMDGGVSLAAPSRRACRPRYDSLHSTGAPTGSPTALFCAFLRIFTSAFLLSSHGHDTRGRTQEQRPESHPATHQDPGSVPAR